MRSLTPQAFEARKDRYFFEKLARKHSDFHECVWYCTSNLIHGNKWIGSMNEEPFTDLKAWHESMDYRFEQELKKLAEDGETFDGLLLNLKLDGKPPRLLQSYASGKTSIHAIGIVECLTGFLSREMNKVIDPLLMWEEHSTCVRAYARILETKIDKVAMKSIVIKVFTSE